MDVHRLRFFLAVSEHLNFSRAALALHTAQPALSQQIRKLEQELGGPLFERTKRHVALTPLGQDLLAHARDIVEAVDSVVVRLRDTHEEPRGSLRVGAILPATLGVLPRLLPGYRRKFPAVDLSATTVGLDEQARALMERRIDVGILRGPLKESRIHASAIAEDFFCVSVPEGHPFARQRFVSVKDLRSATLILLQPDRSGSFYEDIGRLLRRHRVTPARTAYSSDVGATFALVASGVGVSLSSTVFCGVSFPGVVYRPLAPQTSIGTMLMACRRDRQAVPVIRSLFEHVAGLPLVFKPPAM